MKITLSLAEYNKMKKIISKKANGTKTGLDMHELKKMGITTSIGFNSVSLNIDDTMACTVLEVLTEKDSTELKKIATETMNNNSFLNTLMNILITARLRILKKGPTKG